MYGGEERINIYKVFLNKLEGECLGDGDTDVMILKYVTRKVLFFKNVSGPCN
jgi:hypothetical protein